MPRTRTAYCAAVIDLHAHVLPGLDDGPPDTVAAVALADAASRAGTRTLVATPHVGRPEHSAVRVEEIAARTADLQALLDHHAVPLQVLPGAEVTLGAARELRQEQLPLVTLGQRGRYLLLELPEDEDALPDDLEDVVARLGARGVRVLVAHAERIRDLAADPARLGRLIAAGARTQITARSLVGGGPREARRRFALDLLRRGWVHDLASDAHATRERGPDLRPAIGTIREELGWTPAAIDWLVTDAPEAMLAGRLPIVPWASA
ncbi:MAG: Protein-tyrosine-phosphatase [Solirubrobacterales bacterium]|nr:Protein-tyrosine-phosphatase [Solirubrobacterales bacterium]